MEFLRCLKAAPGETLLTFMCFACHSAEAHFQFIERRGPNGTGSAGQIVHHKSKTKPQQTRKGLSQ